MLEKQMVCSSPAPSFTVFPLLLCVWLSLCEFFLSILAGSFTESLYSSPLGGSSQVGKNLLV